MWVFLSSASPVCQRKTFKIASRKRDLGQINQAEFIDSRRAMTDAELNLNVTRFAALASLAELEFAIKEILPPLPVPTPLTLSEPVIRIRGL